MRSLRGRLTLGVTLVLGAVLIVGGVLVARHVDTTERESVDDRLIRTAELTRAAAVAAVEQALPNVDRRLEAVLSATDSSLRLSIGKSVLLETGEPPPGPFTPSATGLSTKRVRGVDYRLYTERLQDPDLGGLVQIEVTSSLASLEANQSRLRRRLAIGALALLLVAAAGVWLAADLVLRPLRRLRTATTSIAGDEDLGRRVPEDDGPAELRSLAESFNEMLTRLNRSAADRTRALDATRRFAADAGHELRTPLTSVQATLSVIARHPQLDPERRAELAEAALAEQRRLVDLLDGLQALARGDAPPGADADVDLAEVVDAAVAAIRAASPAVTVDAVLPDDPVLVHGWEPGLRVLASNLLENAVRHGRDDGTVRVTLTRDAPIVLTVDDDGPGIPATDRDRVFEPFERVTQDGRSAPGSGLGLALVAQQARHHGATVAIGDADLGGARVSVTFPSP